MAPAVLTQTAHGHRSGTVSIHRGQTNRGRHALERWPARGYSNLAFSGRVMRSNKGIAANTTSAATTNPPSMVR